MSILKKMGFLFASCALISIPVLSEADIIQAPIGSGTYTLHTDPSTPGQAQLSWNITQSGGLYTYVYDLTSTSGGNYLIWQQLNNIITNSNLSTYLPGFSGSVSNLSGLGVNFYGTVFGASNNGGIAQWSYTSPLAPIWGSIYVNTSSGSNLIAYNAQYPTAPSPSASDTLAQLQAGYIPTIGVVATPEPSTYLLLGSGLLTCAFLAKRKERAKA
jgi:hypothetical protein